MSKHLIFIRTLMLSVFALPCATLAQESLGNLDDISLESLGDIVTSVSKKPEDSFRSAAAIHVITSEDIKLSGATHVAELLRGVPGINVAQYDSSNWAITSRGFNDFFSNKLLVLIDGRTIYTPLFSGVYWDIQNLVLGDVERIEIIRGPGASLWGANAVNGIINIITKNAADTQGTYVNQVIGTHDRSLTDLRYGGKAGENGYYRAYTKYENRRATQTINNTNGQNNWDNLKTGFRADWNEGETRKITLQGDAYDADINLELSTPSFTSLTGADTFSDKINSRGLNLLGRWQEKHSDTLQSTFQAYFDYQSPDYSSLKQDLHTFDFDYQTAWNASDRHDIMWGAGLRYVNIDMIGSNTLMVANPIDNMTILSSFIQDQIALSPKELYLTIGSKLEHNTFSDFELEPSARLAWYPDNKQTLWTAVSRAVRIPNILENTSAYNIQTVAPGVIAQQQFNTQFDSENLLAYEVGYRVKPVQSLSIDTTLFLNDYDDLRTFEPLAPIPTALGAYLPFQVSNLGTGKTYGFESSINWEVTSRWNLLANYSALNMELDENSSFDPTFTLQEDQSPQHQLMLQSLLYLPSDVRLVNTAYYVDNLPAHNVDSYLRFDTQVIWQPTTNIELALVGQNLLDNQHLEYAAPLGGTANEIPRMVYARATLRY